MKFTTIEDYTPALLLLSFTLTVFILTQRPIGPDIYFHYWIARDWTSGNIGMFSKVVMETNAMPYPPLWHSILIVGVMLNNEMAWASFIQIFMAPLGLVVGTWVAKRLGHNGLMFGLLLLGTWSFCDRALMPIPTSLDFILFPLALLFCYKQMTMPFVTVSILAIYNHGVISLAYLGGCFLWLLLKRNWKPILFISLATLPITIPTVIYAVPSFMRMTFSGMDTEQKKIFFISPLYFMLTYVRLPVIGFPLLVGYIKKRSQLQEEQGLMCLTLLSLLPVAIPWIDRFLEYSVIPLTFIVVSFFEKSKYKKAWTIVLLALALIMLDSLYLLFAGGGLNLYPSQ